MSNVLEMMWKEAVVAYYPSVCQEGLSKMEILSQDSQWRGSASNGTTPKYKSEM
jgi:hypothetical protein